MERDGSVETDGRLSWSTRMSVRKAASDVAMTKAMMTMTTTTTMAATAAMMMSTL